MSKRQRPRHPLPPAYNVAGQHAADRVMRQQAITSPVYLHGEQPPTANQVAAVLHALADFTHNEHMLSDEVADLGRDRLEHGTKWAQATALGRYFHALGDWLAEFPTQPEEKI